MVRYRGLVIADDLTGAADTGHEFAARGHRTVVRLHETALPDASVLVANTDSRECSPADAQDRITTVCNDVTADITYKKIDSTLRGNVTVEVAAALSATGAALAVVAPAFPATNRTTVGGYHLVDDQPVTETIEDVPSAHLPSLFSGSFPVAHVGIDTVRRGSAVVQERFASVLETHDKPVIVICDATHSSHLAAIATGAAALDQSIL
ncbi:MAG TPA: four-carbon acid sugar kinase family protein, partial [Halococcus sp.]|nr:four-carbon acid sugar kinase family protein [Halococcus sp.]